MTKSENIVDQIVNKGNLIIKELKIIRGGFARVNKEYLRSKRKLRNEANHSPQI